jgi:transmembrane sensor
MNERPKTLDSNRQGSRESAAYWLAVLEDPDCTAEERREFIAWLRSATANVDEFLRVGTLLHRLRDPKLWPAKEIQALIDEARAPATVSRLRPGASGSGVPRATRRWATAASVAALLVLGVAAWRIYGTQSETYATSTGEQRVINLADGSRLHLNTRSRVATEFSRKVRRVQLLDGEAIFYVAKDANRPFVVESLNARVTAVGTAFNVRADTQQTTITVLEGRVRVSGSQDTEELATQISSRRSDLILGSGEQAVITQDEPTPRKSPSNPAVATAWTKNRIIFENTPMSEAVAEFARYNSRRVTLVDEELRTRKISGVFASNDLQSLVQFLASDPRVEITSDANGWTVRLRSERSSL